MAKHAQALKFKLRAGGHVTITHRIYSPTHVACFHIKDGSAWQGSPSSHFSGQEAL